MIHEKNTVSKMRVVIKNNLKFYYQIEEANEIRHFEWVQKLY